MKKTISSLLLALFIATPALADTYSYNRAPDSTRTTTTVGAPEYGIYLGLGTIDSKFNFGAGLRFDIPTDINGMNMKFGGQTGFYIGPSDPTTWVIPVLVTATHEFQPYEAVVPYIGIGIGLSVAHVSYMGMGNSSTDFAFMFKPGIKFSGGRYYFELPLGTMAGDFAFLPSLGMHF